MSAPAPIRLSKSKFIAGVQCLKRLYLQVHHPELALEYGEEQDARLEQGHETGALARTAFPGGVLVDAWDTNAALARTAALMSDSSVPAIFEAAFCYRGVLVRVDILQRRRRNRWRVIEVKSSFEVKPHYLYDLAIQRYVLAGCGLDVSSVALMHLNREYRYDGRDYDPHQLFRIRNQTRQVEKIGGGLPKLLKAQWAVLGQGEPPDIASGPQCLDPYRCEFFHNCNSPRAENHISFLPRLSPKKEQELVSLGITLIPQIPDDFPLSEAQHRACTALRTGRPWVSDTLADELSDLSFPLTFMDFESLYPAIPRFAGMWPYSHIPFQWSVHRRIAPDAELEHFAFLADDGGDPRREFIRSLVDALGKRGPIVVYNAGFEAQRLSNLADWIPEYRIAIERIQARLWDLWPFVKRHIYHPQFRGSFSLKTVLPALVPDMTYEAMEVSHGGEAGLAWERMIRGGVDAEERQRLQTALLEYCCQDTLAMVRVLQRLQVLAAKTQARG